MRKVVINNLVSRGVGLAPGPQGPAGATGPTGPAGPTGATGPGLPPGGTTGQQVIKSSSTDYDTEWAAVDTVTVVYDAGWPASRPAATHVLAVGHTSAPSWLTDEDIWFEAVA